MYGFRLIVVVIQDSRQFYDSVGEVMKLSVVKRDEIVRCNFILLNYFLKLRFISSTNLLGIIMDDELVFIHATSSFSLD
jgi:hypothetical protein